MDIKFVKKMEVKEVESTHKIFVAFDGTEFDNRDDCMTYEENTKEKLLSDIMENKAAQGFAGFDGNDHCDGNYYRWFYPQSKKDLETLNMCLYELNLTEDDIGNWICIEYNPYYETMSISYLDDCIKYSKDLLKKFGYKMQLTKEHEVMQERKKNCAEITLQTAKDLINDFTQEEYESDADFSDMSRIAVAYTMTEDEKYEVQAYCDLVNYRIYTTVGGDVVNSEYYNSLDKMTEVLESLDFIELTAYKDAEDYEFEAIEIAGKNALFSNERIPAYVVPEGWNRYDLSGGDDNDYCTVEKMVTVNHSGSIILPGSLELGEKGYIELDDDSSPNFIGSQMTIPEFEDYLTKNILYWGIFFPATEMEKLSHLSHPLDRVIDNPHITFDFKPKTADFSLIGKKAAVIVDGYASDGMNEGVSVILPDEVARAYKNSARPHITLSVAKDGKPVNTRNLKFETVDPIELTGVFDLVAR